MSSTEEEEDSIHPHCLNCINVSKCNARSEQRRSCSITSCKLDCGASFHSCKCQEHHLLCPNVKVQCVNAVNGCPAWLLRSRLGSHLQHCPASVLFCTIEWNRWVLGTGTGVVPLCEQQTGPLQLDLALAKRDVRALRLSCRPGKPQKLEMPEQACPSRPTLLLNGLRHGGDGKAPANLQESANAMDLDNCYQRHIDNIGGASKTAEDCPVSDYWMLSVGDFSAAVEVELQLEFLTRYQAKPGSLLTFPCQQRFRRDEYAWHYQNVHRDIHGGLNGWLEQRCPLAQYGCGFSRRRLQPSPEGTSLVHSELLESFGLTFPLAVQDRQSQELNGSFSR